MGRSALGVVIGLGVGLAVVACATPRLREPRLLASRSDPARLSERAFLSGLRLETGGHRGNVKSVAFSPDAREVYTVGADKVIRVWSVAGHRLRRTLELPVGPAYEGSLEAVATSPDGRLVAAGGCHGCQGFTGIEDTFAVFVLDAESGAIVSRIAGHTASITDLAFSPDGAWLATSSWDGTIRLTAMGVADTAGDSEVLVGHGTAVRSLCWTPDGHRLVSGGQDGLLVVWERHPVGGWFPARAIGAHTRAALGLAALPDGDRVVSGGSDGLLHLWDVHRGERIAQLGASPRMEILSVASSPDGAKVAYGTGGGPWEGTGVAVVAVSEDVAAPARFEALPGAVFDVAWGADDVLAVTVGQMGVVSLRRASDLRDVGSLEPDGSPLFAVGTRASRVAWRGRRQPRPRHYEFALDTDPFQVLAGPEPGERYEDSFDTGPLRMFVRGSPTGHFRIQTKQERPIEVLTGREPIRLWSVLSAERVAFVSRDGLAVVDAQGREMVRCHGHEGPVNGIAPFAGGRILVAASGDQTLRFWNASDCELLLTFYRHGSGEWVAWTPQGYYKAALGGERFLRRQVLEASEDGRTRVVLADLPSSLNRPDVIDRVLRVASVAATLEELDR